MFGVKSQSELKSDHACKRAVVAEQCGGGDGGGCDIDKIIPLLLSTL